MGSPLNRRLDLVKTCDMCGKEKKDVQHVVSRSKLIFGGFRGKMFENRCQACEKKVIKSNERILANLTARSRS